MPVAPKRPCSHPGCRVLVSGGGLCDLHRKARHRQVDQQRGSASERGYDSKWQKARAGFLRKHPLCGCEECKQRMVPLPATVVDHIRPHGLKAAIDSGDQARIDEARRLFWDSSNWMPMAKVCHDRKTARDDGGFGNRRQGVGASKV